MNHDYLREHPLFIQRPDNAEEAYRTFGWARGDMLLAEEEYGLGFWKHWLQCIEAGRFTDPVDDHYALKSNTANLSFYKTLYKTFEHERVRGFSLSDLLEWMAFALGISWCKKLTIRYEAHEYLYNHLDLTMFIKEPSDYLSLLLCEGGHDGVAEYFPTPIDLTKLINNLVESKEGPVHGLQYEPCMGTAPMLLTSPSWNLMGIDLVRTCVLAASIHAFFYKPSLLYCPEPLFDMHLCDMGIYSYYEFNTNTRIYHGNSLFGEFRAPKDIFSEESELIDVYYKPYDISKNDIYYIDHFKSIPWADVPKDLRFRIIKAYARNIDPLYPTSNPPFSMRWANERKKMDELDKKNEAFRKEYEQKWAALEEAAVNLSD